MNSRMEKYYESDNEIPKRTEKNAELYKEINKNDIDKFKLNSNISVLENNNTSIDIDELKDILDKKYTNPPQRKSIFIFRFTSERHLYARKSVYWNKSKTCIQYID